MRTRAGHEELPGSVDELRPLAFTSPARRFGISAALAVCVLNVAYAITLALGLHSLPSSSDPIADPYFAILELLILLIAPAFVGMMAAVHVYAQRELNVFSLSALVFAGVMAGLTSGIHIVLLTVGRQSSFVDASWYPAFLAFRWPSVVYAVDILAWDLFYALAVLCAAPVLRGGGAARAALVGMCLSGLLSLAGLLAIATGEMSIRIIGIVGYAGLLPFIALLVAIVFRQAEADQ